MDHENLTAHQRLDRLVGRLRSQAGLDAVFGGLVGPEHDGFVITCVSGERVAPLVDLAIDVGAGLGGKALILSKPVSVCDYSRADAITHHYDHAVNATGLRSIFAIPVAPSGTPRAVVYGALRVPVPISDVRLAIVHRSVRKFEFDLRVQEEVQRNLAELEVTASVTRMREELRDIYAEVSAIAEQVVDPQLKARIKALSERARSGRPVPLEPVSSPLTKRELDVAAQVAAGCTNAEVAERLGLEPSTVKSYLKSAMRKLGVRNRVEFVTACRRQGLLP
ncbi:MAG: winged helix-turn-helix transcriptional regulator [Actinophytocola sp.]|nr:winged helix-turn-helix transcriptional regulator [Actinophytocola sp.]